MDNNPLKQYFRRPSLYIKFPSNNEYYDDSIIARTQTDEYPVYPMTAIDEITSKTPDALYSGQAVVDIIKSCVPNIIDPWQVVSTDLNSILIAIRIASIGDALSINKACPACNEDNSYDIDLNDLLAIQKVANFKKTIKVRDLEIKFKPITFFESNQNNIQNYELQKSMFAVNDSEQSEEAKLKIMREIGDKLNTIIFDILCQSIEYIKTPETIVTDKSFIKEFIINTDRRTSNDIREYGMKLAEENQIKPLKCTCSSCGHEFEQILDLNISNFFD